MDLLGHKLDVSLALLKPAKNSPKQLYHFTLTPAMKVRLAVLHRHQHFVLSVFSILTILVVVKQYLIVVLIFISLMTNDSE